LKKRKRTDSCLKWIPELLQRNQEDIRESTLFLIRQWSSGGTVDLDLALGKLGKLELSEFSQCPILNEIAKAIQRVSPMAFIPDFTQAVACLHEFSLNNKDQQQLRSFSALPEPTKRAAISSFCLEVAPIEIPHFRKDLYPLLEPSASRRDASLFNILFHFTTQLKSETKELHELILHYFLFSSNRSPLSVHYNTLASNRVQQKAQVGALCNQISECLIPRCPRCGSGFMGLDGCFSVKYRNCPCSFCGFCLADCGSDAHAHVLTHGRGYYGHFQDFQRGFGQRATEKIRNILGSVNPDLKELIDTEVPKILARNDFFV